MINYCE